MLTRARSLFSRVFSSDPRSSQIRLDETFVTDDNHSGNDDRLQSNVSYHSAKSINNLDNDNGSLQSLSTEGNYKRAINENFSSSMKTKSNFHYTHSHEKSKQNRLINAMQIATFRGNIELMKRLLTNLDIDINHHDQYGMSYFEHAILMGSFDMADLLVRHGCDLHRGNSSGHSYLYVAIETTTNKSLAIIRLLLESNCSYLHSLDITSLTSLTQIIHLNSQDYLILNTHLLFILKYHIHRMVFDDLLHLISYLIMTNLLLCKNDEQYGLHSCAKREFHHMNRDYISLFIKTFGLRHVSKLEYRIQNLQVLFIPPLISLAHDDIQPYIKQIRDAKEHVFELKHLCRSLIRQKLNNLKTSTIVTLVSTVKLQDYLLYTPI